MKYISESESYKDGAGWIDNDEEKGFILMISSHPKRKSNSAQNRIMRDGKTPVLDTLSSDQLLLIAARLIGEQRGNENYRATAERIVSHRAGSVFALNLKQRRCLMGFVRNHI